MEFASRVILIVEDEPETADLLRELLEQAGYAVKIAVDAATALSQLTGEIDLVLLDRMLPDLDGVELCRLLRAHGGASYLPIIMLTSLASPEQRHAGFAMGADDYLTKPFEVTELLDRVQVWVRTRQRLKAVTEPPQHEQPAPDAVGLPHARPSARKAVSPEDVVGQYIGLLHHAVAEAAQHPGFLAAALVPYARAQGWDEGDLAAALNCPPATLPQLLLHRRPLPPTWETDVAVIAEACGADPQALATVLRAAEAREGEATP